MHDVKDSYYWYVIKGPVPDKVFWNMDICFVKGLIIDDIAYEQWLAYQMKKEEKKHG